MRSSSSDPIQDITHRARKISRRRQRRPDHAPAFVHPVQERADHERVNADHARQANSPCQERNRGAEPRWRRIAIVVSAEGGVAGDADGVRRGGHGRIRGQRELGDEGRRGTEGSAEYGSFVDGHLLVDSLSLFVLILCKVDRVLYSIRQ